MHVSGLFVYPVKSLRGIALERAQLDDRGFRHDRRWMLVDAGGVFISQREAHRMALIDVALSAHVLTITAPGMDALRVPLESDAALLQCRVWRDVVDAAPVSAEADSWFSSFLGTTCRLVYMPDATRRIVDRTYVKQERIVGFADGFPLLIIGQASLDDLNARLAQRGEAALPMRRFRPNVVVAESAAYEEDGWRQIRIGDVDVDVVKPCARCVVTTVDPESALTGKEPLRTLATYRKLGPNVYFGQNAVHHRPGSIAAGDAVAVIKAQGQ